MKFIVCIAVLAIGLVQVVAGYNLNYAPECLPKKQKPELGPLKTFQETHLVAGVLGHLDLAGVYLPIEPTGMEFKMTGKNNATFSFDFNCGKVDVTFEVRKRDMVARQLVVKSNDEKAVEDFSCYHEFDEIFFVREYMTTEMQFVLKCHGASGQPVSRKFEVKAMRFGIVRVD